MTQLVRALRSGQITIPSEYREKLGIDEDSFLQINLIEGESYEETAKLASAGEQFDIIISDTFPLTPDEEGLNDLRDLDILKRMLSDRGVFTFFAYFPGSEGGVVKDQKDIINAHFRDYNVTEVEINPAPTYKYLYNNDTILSQNRNI